MMMSILITGGAGFFGQAFVRRLLAEHRSERICIFSRDEYKQAVMRRDFANDERLRFFVGDVRDQARLRTAMSGVDVVVHAAALKRIETCHYNPGEIVKTNVLGTMNVIDAAVDAHVSKVLLLSTDKAFEPVSAYGQSKAMAESLVLAAHSMHGERGPICAVTRYGNVAGSTGSVIPTWRNILRGQIGKRVVPVTHPDATRFWMTEAEAVDLVINTIDTMIGGELVIPTLPAYRLGDLAEAMDAEMDIVGLPAREKMHESMRHGESSARARRMSVEELRQALGAVHG